MLDLGWATIGAADQSLDLLDMFLAFTGEPLAETSHRMADPLSYLQTTNRRLVVSQRRQRALGQVLLVEAIPDRTGDAHTLGTFVSDGDVGLLHPDSDPTRLCATMGDARAIREVQHLDYPTNGSDIHRFRRADHP